MVVMCAIRLFAINIVGLASFLCAVWLLLPTGVKPIRGPKGYIVALLVNEVWFAVSSGLARSSEGYGLENIWRDGLVAVQVGAIITACTLIQGSASDSWRRWVASLLFGLAANILALSDTLCQIQSPGVEGVTSATSAAWIPLNVAAIVCFLAVLVFVVVYGIRSRSVHPWFLANVGLLAFAIVGIELCVVFYCSARATAAAKGTSPASNQPVARHS
jgi:hypothetical protein